LRQAESVYDRAILTAPGSFHPTYPTQHTYGLSESLDYSTTEVSSCVVWVGERDYEQFGDEGYAKDRFERGVQRRDENCLCRMGNGHLLGLLGPDAWLIERALSYWPRLVRRISMFLPQPSYIIRLLSSLRPIQPLHALNPNIHPLSLNPIQRGNSRPDGPDPRFLAKSYLKNPRFAITHRRNTG
jgi:hypothetical protein